MIAETHIGNRLKEADDDVLGASVRDHVDYDPAEQRRKVLSLDRLQCEPRILTADLGILFMVAGRGDVVPKIARQLVPFGVRPRADEG